MNVHVEKTIPISYQMVVEAYRKVKQGGKAAGIDGETWTDFIYSNFKVSPRKFAPTR